MPSHTVIGQSLQPMIIYFLLFNSLFYCIFPLPYIPFTPSSTSTYPPPPPRDHLTVVHVHEKICFIFLKILFLGRGREEAREGEKHQCVVASPAPPTGDLACNPGTCPDWESNWQPCGSQASAQCTSQGRK